MLWLGMVLDVGLRLAVLCLEEQTASVVNGVTVAVSVVASSDICDCLHRYMNILHPDLKRGDWTAEEDKRLMDIVSEIGPGIDIFQNLAHKLNQ